MYIMDMHTPVTFLSLMCLLFVCHGYRNCAGSNFSNKKRDTNRYTCRPDMQTTQ